MCGRYVAASSPDDLVAYFGTEPASAQLEPSYNVAPTHEVYGVVEAAPGTQAEGHRLLEVFRWGLVPSWATDPSIGNRMINARAETVTTKPAFRSAVDRRRCLVPADGFFEWQKLDRGKQPWFIHRRDGEPLALAGLWERWRDRSAPGDAPWLHSVCIITTEANGDLAPLHDRMPVMLDAGCWDTWLDPEIGADEVRALLAPAPVGVLARHRVDAAVGKVSNNSPELIEPS